MTNLVNFDATNNQAQNYKSVELVNQINIFRDIEGNRAILQHKDFLKAIEDEFEDEIGEGNISPTSYTDKSNRQSKCYNLDYEQSLQMLMRESKFVRKGVAKFIKENEKQFSESILPQTFGEALILAGEIQLKLEQTTQQLDEAIKTKQQISNTQTASALGKVGGLTTQNRKMKIQLQKISDYATIGCVESKTHQTYNWAKLKKYCNDNELNMIDVPVEHKNYSTVKSYPREAWAEVYGIDLDEIYLLS